MFRNIVTELQGVWIKELQSKLKSPEVSLRKFFTLNSLSGHNCCLLSLVPIRPTRWKDKGLIIPRFDEEFKMRDYNEARTYYCSWYKTLNITFISGCSPRLGFGVNGEAKGKIIGQLFTHITEKITYLKHKIIFKIFVIK